MKAIRFSEAIRLGAMLKPQAYHRMYDAVTGGTCALGAALDAVGMLTKWANVWLWTWTATSGGRCPLCMKWDDFVSSMVIHMNDDHKCTRERIADWVATIEPARSRQKSGSLKRNRALPKKQNGAFDQSPNVKICASYVPT